MRARALRPKLERHPRPCGHYSHAADDGASPAFATRACETNLPRSTKRPQRLAPEADFGGVENREVLVEAYRRIHGGTEIDFRRKALLRRVRML